MMPTLHSKNTRFASKTVSLFNQWNAMLLLLFMMLSGGMFGQTTVSHTFSDTFGTIDSNTSFTTQQNDAANAPYFGSELRLYYTSSGNGCSISLTPSNGAVITQVKLYAVSTSYTTTVKYNVDGGSDVTASLSSTTYTISSIASSSLLKIRNANSSSKQLRISSIEVTYTLPPAGIVSNGNGPWNSGSTWVGGEVPTAAQNAIIKPNHIVTVATGIPVTRNSGTTTTVESGGTLAVAAAYTNNGTTTIEGSFQINGGGFATGNNDFVYGANGNLIFNHNGAVYGPINGTHKYWPSASGPKNVTLNTSSPINIEVSRTVAGTFKTASGVTLSDSAILTLNDICEINAGGFFANAPLFGSASTLVYNHGGTYGRGLEWSHNGVGIIGTTAGYPNNIQISNNTTFNYNNGTPGNKAIAGNLTIDSGSFYMDYGGNASGGTLTIAGNVTNHGNFTLGNANGDDLYIGGNFSNMGNFYPNNRAVFFNGTAAQTITGATTFDYLTINNANGVTLNNSVVNNLTLNFLSGKLTLGNNDITIGSGGTITNATAAKYIVTNGTGQLKRTVGNTAILFPVGPNTAYNPIMVSNTGTPDVYGFRVTPDVGGSAGSAFQINNSWYVSEAVAGESQLRVEPQWNSGDQGTSFSALNNLIQLYPTASSFPATVAGQTASITTASNNFTNTFTGTEYFVVGQLQSNTSDIITDATFTYDQNINYNNYITSNITSTNSVTLGRFIIRDGGISADADAFATTLSNLSLTVSNASNLEKIALYDGVTEIAELSASGTVTFTGINVAALDNGTKTFIIRASFKTTVTDNEQIVLSIASATALGTGSGFGTISATTSSVGDDNRIEVIADQLVFIQQPSTTGINVAMTPEVTVAANDVNGNRDFDYTEAIEITSDGTLTGDPVTATAVNGLATFNNLVHTVAGTNLQILAGYGTLVVLSDAFDITQVFYTTNDYRTILGTGLSWDTASHWQRANASGGWNAAGADGTPSSSRNVYIRGAMTTNGSKTANKIIIASGGALTVSASTNSTAQTLVMGGGSLILNATFNNNGTFEVEDNGNVFINSYSANSDTSLWKGTEVFSANSTFTYNYARLDKVIFEDETSLSTNPATGAKFGNLILQPTVFANTGQWNGIMPNGTYTLTKNDFIINNSSDKNFTLNGGDITVGGNMIINITSSGDVATKSTSGTASLTVNGNLIETGTGTGIFRLNGSGTYTLNVDGNILVNAGQFRTGVSTNASNITTVNLKSNLTISASGFLDSNNSFAGAVNFNFCGTGDGLTPTTTQTIDIASINASENKQIAFNVKPNAYVKLINRDWELGTSASLTVENGATLDFGFAGTSALNIMRVQTPSTTSGQVFNANSGSTLQITSPDGISGGNSNYTGNVQIGSTEVNRVFDAGANYHYIGKQNQVSGNGLPNALTGTITVELDTDALLFNASGNKTIATGGTLDIKKGIVVDDSTNSFGDVIDNNGNLTMSGGRYMISKTGTQPNLSGTYSLSAGVVEFAGSLATVENIRAETYQNIEVTGNNIGKSSGEITLNAEGTFTVKPNGVFTINSQSITGLAGTQTLTVENGGTFKTGDQHGFSGATNTSVHSNIENIVLQAGSTVEYSRALAQTITNQTGIVENSADTGDDNSHYSNLKLSGAGTKSFMGTTLKVGKNLDVEETSLLPVSGNQTLIVNNKITTVNADATLSNSVAGDLSNISTTTTKGVLIQNNGSLVQIADANLNEGKIQMERIAKPMFRYDYTYWSSPVASTFTLNNLSPNTLANKYFKWNHSATTPTWEVIQGGSEGMVAAKGYIVRAPQTFDIEGVSGANAALYTANFIGKPNNGTVNIGVTGSTVAGETKWNLIGNPYPSAVDANAFLDLNAPSVNPTLGGTLYFWTHNTNIASSGTMYSYNSADYAAWNDVGGTATTAGEGEINNATPTGKIAAGQGFFIKGLVSGDATFNNSMRIAGENDQFFKNPTPIEKHRVWLNMKGTTKGFSQTLVGYVSNATNALDNRFDGETFGGNQVTFYSMLDTKALVIQGRAVPFMDTDTVPLGYKTTLTENISIGIDHFDGLFDNQDIYLEDNVLNVVHDLKASAYTFAAVPGTFNNRFVLRYLPEEVLANPTFDEQLHSVTIRKNESILRINSPYETIQTVAVYDIMGRLIFEQTDCNTNTFETSNLVQNQQALIVKVKLNNGGVVTKKVL